MTEEEARAWVRARCGEEVCGRLDRFVAALVTEATQQNLVSASTLDHIWARHIVDSAQLVPLGGEASLDREWIDIGSGAGLPGIVAAILQPRTVLLVEPRKRRAAFLRDVVDQLALPATVIESRIQTLRHTPAAIISARAVASLDELFRVAGHLAARDTIWLLPKGRSAQSELEAVRHSWHGVFHVEHSVTAANAQIVVAQGIRAR